MKLKDEVELEMKIFCNNLVYLRKKHNFSCLEMAIILHTSVETIKSIEKGEIPETAPFQILINASYFFKKEPFELFVINLNESKRTKTYN